MTWPKIRYPFYDRCGWQSCLKHNFWRAFVYGLIDNDERIASSKKQFKTRVQKPYPIQDQNGQNWYPIYDQDSWKTISFGAAHTYIAHIREYPPPRNTESLSVYSCRQKAKNAGRKRKQIFYAKVHSLIKQAVKLLEKSQHYSCGTIKTYAPFTPTEPVCRLHFAIILRRQISSHFGNMFKSNRFLPC